MQAACPKGAGRDEGPASLPVLITKRQGTRRQINGKGLGTNAGHALRWNLAFCVWVFLCFTMCKCLCVWSFPCVWVCACGCMCLSLIICVTTEGKRKTLASNDCWITRRWNNLKTSALTVLIFTPGHVIAWKPLNYAVITSDSSVNPFSPILTLLPLYVIIIAKGIVALTTTTSIPCSCVQLPLHS